MAEKSRVNELMDNTMVVEPPPDAVVGLAAPVVGLLGAAVVGVVVGLEVVLLWELLHAAAVKADTSSKADMALRLLTGGFSPYLRAISGPVLSVTKPRSAAVNVP
jgi:hypothetical protein